MARISLLFSFAFVLALGSLFLSVSGHAPHGRELTEAEYNANSHAGADVEGFESIYEKLSHFFGGYIGGQAPRRELYIVGPAAEAPVAEAPAGVKAAAPAGEITKDVSQRDFDNFFRYFYGDKTRSKAHRRELFIVDPATEAPAGEKAKDVSQSNFDKFFRYFYGDKTRSKAHRRELFIVGPTADAPAGVNAAAPAGKIVKDVSQSDFDHFFRYYYGDKTRGKAHRRGLYTQAPGIGKVKESFKDLFNVGFGGKVQYDAAGKMKVAGKDGFRSLNRAHYKHFASTEA